jgi:hypothetical protein
MRTSILNERLFASFEEQRQINVCAGVIIGAQYRHVDNFVQRGLRSHFAIRRRYSWEKPTHRAFNKWPVGRDHDTWRRNSDARLQAAAE